MPAFRIALALHCALLAFSPAHAAGAREPAHPSVPGLRASHLDAAFWIAARADADALLMDAGAIRAQNARMVALDPTVHDLAGLPDTVSAAAVRALLEPLASASARTLFGEDGQPLVEATLRAEHHNAALDDVGDAPARFGLVVARADLRALPTARRVFSTPHDRDIDRWQESALFPGDVVVALHPSADGAWWFVLSQRYAAWIDARHVAFGPRAGVLEHARRAGRVVTGARVATVYSREAPALSRVALDMGVRLPLADIAPDQPINGQLSTAGYAVTLPVRGPDGTLRFAPALVARSEDTSGAPLPFTRANVIAQAFKFLGERYGWGHADGGRDCSGFVSEVYRSMGIELPRNTGDQARSPALAGRTFDAGDTNARRDALGALDVGDLVYVPGHVMLVIGHVDGAPWVIHDTAGAWMRQGAKVERLPFNGVVVTPLAPLMFDAATPMTERVTAVRRVRATSP